MGESVRSYVVAKRARFLYAQDYFPFQHHRLLGRGMSRGILTGVDTSSQEHTALDPSYTDPTTVHVAGDDSDGLESDDEVKAVVGQLDEFVTRLSSSG